MHINTKWTLTLFAFDNVHRILAFGGLGPWLDWLKNILSFALVSEVLLTPFLQMKQLRPRKGL